MNKSILILIALLVSLVVIGCSAQASTPPQASKEIVISYYTIIYGTPWIGDSQNLLPSSDSELVITNFTVENRGYDTFVVNKNYFSAIVKGTTYSNSTCYVADPLPDTEITSGNTVKGNVPYTFPELTMNSDIAWQYLAPEKYNITWVNLGASPPTATQTGS